MARRVALHYLTARPVSVLGALVPGKFVFDFLARIKEIRWSEARMMPPRLEALSAARTRTEAASGAAEESSDRLVTMLADHYRTLLGTGEAHHGDMVRAAYPHRDEYEAALAAVARAEEERDLLAVEARGGDEKLAARLEGHRRSAAEQRRRLADDIYLGA